MGILEEEYRRVCPYCGTVFIAAHLNRKYCPDPEKKCKSKYERQQKQKKRAAEINEQMVYENNISILNRLVKQGKKIVTQQELSDLGFDHKNYLVDYIQDGYNCIVGELILKMNTNSDYLINPRK